MFDIDSIFNYIIFLIPVALIVTRLVNRARAKNAPPPKKPPQPYIPVHFEDDSAESELGYFKNRVAQESIAAPKQVQARKTQKAVAAPFTPKPNFSSFMADTPRPTPVKSVGATSTLKRNDFTSTLNHLSPLKQAVVMAEILGQPKGMM